MIEVAVRAFVAVELPDYIKSLLADTQSLLQEAMGETAGGVRWTRPESVHITLQFLGDVPADMVSKIGLALEDACAGASPVELALGGVGWHGFSFRALRCTTFEYWFQNAWK